MKLIFFIIASLLLSNFSVYSQASEFIISNKISIHNSSANQIAHSGELVIFKFKYWSYTHEVISPEKFIASVDLSGFEYQFIKGIFEKKSRAKLPNWLSILADDLSKKIMNHDGEYQKINLGDSIIYGTYNVEEHQGFIFVLEEHAIHKLDVLGTTKNYTDFINNITKRN